jgi:phage I-like protein
VPNATPKHLELCAFRAAGLSMEGGLPARLVVVPWGAHGVGGRGSVIVDDRTVAAFSAGQQKLGRDGLVAGDFEHNTVEGTATFNAEKEPRLVAAWGKASIEPGVGIVVEGLSYTPEGEAALKGGHYQDISPAVIRDKTGLVLGLHSFAFCRHGQIENFTIDLAAAKGALATALSALAESYSPESNPMKPTAELLSLLSLLGIEIETEADEAATAAAIAGATEKVKAMIEAKPADVEVDDMSAKITALSADVTALKSERDELKRAELVRQATAEGKVIPLSAETLKVTPLNVLADIIAQAKPGQVPMQSQQAAGEAAEAAKPEAFTPEQIEVFARFGLKPEQVAQKPAK